MLEIELRYQGIPFSAQPKVELSYRDETLKQKFRPDFLCYDNIILEIKAVDHLIDKHRAQVLNYLNARGFQLGLPVNFGAHPKLESERIPFSSKRTANE